MINFPRYHCVFTLTEGIEPSPLPVGLVLVMDELRPLLEFILEYILPKFFHFTSGPNSFFLLRFLMEHLQELKPIDLDPDILVKSQYLDELKNDIVMEFNEFLFVELFDEHSLFQTRKQIQDNTNVIFHCFQSHIA